MSPVNPELFDEDLATIRARRAGGMRLGSQVPVIERIPLESPALMRITEGGIPIGRVTRLWGEPSSGKSLMAYFIMAAAQRYRSKLFPKGLRMTYWDVEGVWDQLHASHLGVDVDTVGFNDARRIEDIAGELELSLRSCHMHVIDSASAAKATDMLAAGVNDWQIAPEARAWGRAWDRIEDKFDTQENVIILIDHMSEHFQSKVRRAKGARALEYASSLSIEFSKGGWLFYHPKQGYLEKADKIQEEVGAAPSGLKEPDGAEVNVRVNKSRVCRPFRAAKLRFDFHRIAYDMTFELLDAAKFFDIDGVPAHRSGNPAIAQKTGPKSSYYTLPTREKAVQGVAAVRAEIENDPELAAIVRKAMLAGW